MTTGYPVLDLLFIFLLLAVASGQGVSPCASGSSVAAFWPSAFPPPEPR